MKRGLYFGHRDRIRVGLFLSGEGRQLGSGLSRLLDEDGASSGYQQPLARELAKEHHHGRDELMRELQRKSSGSGT